MRWATGIVASLQHHGASVSDLLKARGAWDKSCTRRVPHRWANCSTKWANCSTQWANCSVPL